MRNRLLVGFILFAFIATALLVIPIGITLESHESSNTLSTLKRDTSALSALLTDALNHNDLARAVALADSYAKSTKRQVLVVDRGVVLVATRTSQTHDGDLIKIANSVRLRELAGQTKGNASEGPQFYVAILLSHVATGATPDHDVLVVTYPVKVNNQQIHRDWTELVLYGLVMLALACFFGLFVSSSLVKPLRRIGTAVEAIGSGSLDVRAPVTGGPPELRRLAESINSTAVRLINLLQAQRVFVQDASHQLRTPLTALQLHLENLQHGEGQPGTDLAAVIAEVNRLSRLVDSLLVLARAESTSPDLVTVDLHEAALERVEVWRPLADELQISLVASVPPSAVVLATPGALEQILDNLLSNAFDATPPGGLVSVESSVSDDSVELHVLDTGPGLSPADRALALQRFWRGRSNANEGTGLGLAIVDQLTRLCGGSVELREAASGGVDATVSLRRG